MLTPTIRTIQTFLGQIPGVRKWSPAWNLAYLTRPPACGSPPAFQAWFEELRIRSGVERRPPWSPAWTPDSLGCESGAQRLAEWLHALHSLYRPASARRPQRLLLFSVMPHWVAYCVPLAITLAGLDVQVDFVWGHYRDMGQAEPGESVDVPCPRPALARAFPFLQVHRRLRFGNLLDLPPGPATEELRRLAGKHAHRDTCYLTYRELVELGPDDQQVHALRQARNLLALRVLDRLLARRRYDAALIPNGGIFEFGAAFDLCKARGLHTVNFDFSERKRAIVGSAKVPCAQMDTEQMWQDDSPHELTPQRRQLALAALTRRTRHNWNEDDYTWSGQPVALRPGHEVAAQLGLDLQRPIALLCTNISWDTAILGRTGIFPSMAEWIVRTIRWFAGRPDWQLVVRVHPAEATLPIRQPAVEVIASAFPRLPAHVHVVGPEAAVNTYALTSLARLGLVLATTTGLEMAARGILVVVAGEVHYAGKGFTAEPASEAEHFSLLEACTAQPESCRLRPEQIDLALAYAEMYFDRFPRPFPWWEIPLGASCTDELPVERILAGDCPQAFLETFAYLAGGATIRGLPARAPRP
jgi:hypothetical protein